MKPSEILDKAADLIEPEGAWTQGEWGLKGGFSLSPERIGSADCFCIEGAIAAVSGCRPSMAFANPAAKLLAKHLGIDMGTLPVWNDAPERTQAEVVTALRQAAELARKDGQ